MTKDFSSSEAGAVTVDWVVLTAALVGLGLATMSIVTNGTEDLSDDIETELSANIISSSFDSGPTDYDFLDEARGQAAIQWYASEIEGGEVGADLYRDNLMFVQENIEAGNLQAAQWELDHLIAAHKAYGDGSNPSMDLAAIGETLQAENPSAYATLDEAYTAYIAKWPET